MIYRKYTVSHKRGFVEVKVPDGLIELRGERQAVVDAAWSKLLGYKDEWHHIRGYYQDCATRDIIMSEIYSRYQAHRGDVYDTFREVVTITWVGVEHV